jgi:4-hydroxythreonine-4-phosphate dehydrogenase
MNYQQTPRLVCTVGDINGIGVEVLVRALAHDAVHRMCQPMIVGNTRLLREYLQALSVCDADVTESALVIGGRHVPIIDIPSHANLNFGVIDASAGKLAGDAIAHSTRMTIQGKADAVVTMPISKASLHAGGHDFPGHTEMIASITGGTPLMILMTEGLRVGLATIHVPISAVPALITRELVAARIQQLDAMLRHDFAIASPRIVVLGLNPHAGEMGEIGREDVEIIGPVVEQMQRNGIAIDGPLPADGFFARFTPGSCDAVLAMYHDQGLIPLKMFARGHGVNFTANLPIVRTSPDHGTAFAIAGRGVADESSVIEAIEVAVEVVGNRRERA